MSGFAAATFYGNSDNLGDFEIGEAEIARSQINTDEATSITIPVENVGDRDGTELVQVYVRKNGDDDGPIRTLRGYQRVDVAAGSEESVTIDLPPSTFEFYNREHRKMDITPDEYVVYYGNSSAEEDLQKVSVILK